MTIQDLLWSLGAWFALVVALGLVLALTEHARAGTDHDSGPAAERPTVDPATGSAYRRPANPDPPPLAVASVRWVGEHTEEAVLTLNDGRAFRGSVSVWHAYPSGEPAHDMADWLAPRWRAAKWARDDGEGGA